MGLLSAMRKFLSRRKERRRLSRAPHVVTGNRILALEKEVYGRKVEGRYDAAQTTHDNQRHWAEADFLSPETANDPATRRELRSRSRYECHEANSLARGIVLTLTNSVIGSGPQIKVRLRTPEEITDKKSRKKERKRLKRIAAFIKREFTKWAKEIRLAEKLRTAKTAKVVDGETFIQAINNDRLKSPVKLDLVVNEADMIATPSLAELPQNAVDGIEFDEHHNPTVYHRLKEHPGGSEALSAFTQEFDRIPAEEMIHIFRADRPGQKRGVPEVTTALPLFAMLRRYGLAVLSAAEAVANISGVLYTDGPAVEADEVEPLDAVDWVRNMLMSLPRGWKYGQIKAEQPTTTFGDFRAQIVSEIGRCVNMPYIVAALNSKGANFASGKLDTLGFNRDVKLEQSIDWDCELDRIFGWWLDEALMIPGYLPEGIPPNAIEASWMWNANDVIDEAKYASSTLNKLKAGVTTLPREYAKLGLDWEEEQKAAAESLGITVAEYQKLLRDSQFSVEAVEDDTDDETEAVREGAAAA